MKYCLELTNTELNQLRTYVEWAKEDGSYYGPKKHWDKRHESIERKIEQQFNEYKDRTNKRH